MPIGVIGQWSRATGIVACLVLVLVPPPEVSAAPAPTRCTLIDIGPVSGMHNFSYEYRFGVNSLREAVGSNWDLEVESEPVEFAWIYLLQSNYGLSAGRHRLFGPGGTYEDGPTRAFAINDNGIVVGQARFDGEDHAALWDLSESLEPIDLGLLSTGNGESTSMAFAVSNASTPTVVGRSPITT